MKTSVAKAKGRRLQQRVAKYLAEEYDLVYGQDEDLGSREMGQIGVDVKMSKEAKAKIPFDIECKNQETWHLAPWWTQCLSNNKENRVPLLVISKNRHEDLAVLRFTDLIKLIKGDKNEEKSV